MESKDSTIKDVFSIEDAEDDTTMDLLGNVGKSFLEGLAINSDITLEQKMSLKAMKAIIDSMADSANEARLNNPEIAPTANKLAGASEISNILSMN